MSSLRQKLKDATAEAHHRLDHHSLMSEIMRPDLTVIKQKLAKVKP